MVEFFISNNRREVCIVGSIYDNLVNASKLMEQFNKPMITPQNFPPIKNRQFADTQHEIIMKTIAEFEKSLDEEHEVAIQLASFGQSITMHVIEIGYSNPSLMHFYGFVNGSKAELIQHISQLNFLLLSAPKLDSEKPARRIGFVQEPEP